MHKLSIVIILLFLSSGVSAVDIEFKNPESFKKLGLPFSEAVRVGDLLFLSGQLGNQPGSLSLVEGGVETETRQTMENIKAVLESNQLGLDRVVKCTLFLADIAEWPKVNAVYKTYFGENPPARSALAASGLALDARVEIECIAAY
ncbi:MAG: 2-iminobutanoate/2-iminopropanoate deaminase [Patiriisocius sp.]|jgi:2-iminobutanoate/2-iminopropanoate deaminase